MIISCVPCKKCGWVVDYRILKKVFMEAILWCIVYLEKWKNIWIKKVITFSFLLFLFLFLSRMLRKLPFGWTWNGWVARSVYVLILNTSHKIWLTLTLKYALIHTGKHLVLLLFLLQSAKKKKKGHVSLPFFNTKLQSTES